MRLVPLQSPKGLSRAAPVGGSFRRLERDVDKPSKRAKWIVLSKMHIAGGLWYGPLRTQQDLVHIEMTSIRSCEETPAASELIHSSVRASNTLKAGPPQGRPGLLWCAGESEGSRLSLICFHFAIR